MNSNKQLSYKDEMRKLDKLQEKKEARLRRYEQGRATKYDMRIINKEQKRIRLEIAADIEKEEARNKEILAAATTADNGMDEGEMDFGGGDDWFDDDMDDMNTSSNVTVHSVPMRSFEPKKARKQFWVENNHVLLNAFIQSYTLHDEEPDFRLVKPKQINKPEDCDCAKRGCRTLTGYMFGGPCSFDVDFCKHRSLLETLILCQMLPTATNSPKSAVHFSVFEYGAIAKLNGYVSNHGFTKMYNAWCLQRGGFRKDFRPLSASVYNMLQVIYRNVSKHAMDKLRQKASMKQQVGCYACHGSKRKFIAMDGNFSLRRRKDRTRKLTAEAEGGVFAASKEEKQLWGTPEEVAPFDIGAEVKDEECLLRDLDSDFKATSSNRREVGSRFDESGVFSINCGRHGIVERAYDIYGGEGRKYALAGIADAVKQLAPEQKLAVMYDIICLCKKKVEEYVPSIVNHDPKYAVTIFHALAHSLNCQVDNYPRYVDYMGLTDGKGVERSWSHSNHFVSMSRNMSKLNRHSLLTEVFKQYKSEKTDTLALYIKKKYSAVVKKISMLNITIADYRNIEIEWNNHAENLCIRPNMGGLDKIQNNAERLKALGDPKVYYFILNAQFLTLRGRKDYTFVGYHVEHMKNTLLLKIERMESIFGYPAAGRPKKFNDPAFIEYHALVKDCRYDALDGYLTHLLFAIIMRERKLHQPAGSSGSAKAARIIVSLETIFKHAERLVILINNHLNKYFDHEQRLAKQKSTVGKEVEKLKNSSNGENILGLSDAMSNWHLLNRHVEEAELLTEESKNFVKNLEDEMQDLKKALLVAPNFLIKKQYLQTSRRLHIAKNTLKNVMKAVAPSLSVVPTAEGSLNDFVVIFNQDSSQYDRTDDEDDKEGEEDEEGEDDEDFEEGGDNETSLTEEDIEDALALFKENTETVEVEE